MISPKDVIADQLQRSAYLFQTFTQDFTDAEYFLPAVAGSNHAAWILGHIACAEDWGRWLLTGSAKQINESPHALFKGGSTCVADAAKYPSRLAVDALFQESRARLVEALGTFDPGRWEEPTPEHGPRKQFATLGALWALMGFHPFWHIGQLTTCRVALKKKAMLS